MTVLEAWLVAAEGNVTAAIDLAPDAARRADSPISFREFTRKGAVVTAISAGLSALYLWLRYFVLS